MPGEGREEFVITFLDNLHYTQARTRSGPRFVLEARHMAKAFARKFYSSKAWQDCRNEYAKRQHHLCENCLRRGIYKPGVIVHHKIEIDPVTIERPEIALNFDNLELLCRDCHAEAHDLTGGRWAKINQKKREDRDKRRRFSIDENGKVFAR